jgi:AraC family transcriptional regulator
MRDTQACPLPLAAIEPRPATQVTDSQRALVAATKRRIAARPEERLSLEELSRAVGVTAPHLTSVFRAVEGVPLYQYLLRARLERAMAMLLPHERPEDLSEIALQVGFSSHSHFTAAFRRMFGCAPGIVRSRAAVICGTIRSLRPSTCG